MSDAPGHSGPVRKAPHPFLYFVLFLPFGATSGFISVTLGALAKKHGMSDEVITAIIAWNVLPNTPKFLWAPLVDTVWTGKGWYVSMNLLSSLAIVTLGFIPIVESNTFLISAVVLVNGAAVSFVAMCTEALMAKLTPPEQRGAAGGWSQAGNVGGAFVGGLGLMIANNTSIDWLPFVIVGALLMSCSFVALRVKEPPRTGEQSFLHNTKILGRDIWALLTEPKRTKKVKPWPLFFFPPVFLYALSGAGILALFLSLMPIGSGGAQNVFPLMGAEWHTSDNLVAFSNGLVTGGAAIVGSLLGGVLSSKIDKRWAYALSGLIIASFAFLMAILPKTAPFYVGCCILYSIGLGMCYATFTAFVLDIIGHTGGATKYNVFAALSNIPIVLMTRIDGWAATHWGRENMLWVDGLAGVGGAVCLMVLVFMLRAMKVPTRPAIADVPLEEVEKVLEAPVVEIPEARVVSKD
ncbi:MAG TPA: MFS transporter [Kofleriaceae bacterium]|jgi:MFS family permease